MSLWWNLESNEKHSHNQKTYEFGFLKMPIGNKKFKSKMWTEATSFRSILELFICNYCWVLIWPYELMVRQTIMTMWFAKIMRLACVYLSARILKGRSFHSNFNDPPWSCIRKIVVALAATIVYTFAWIFWF